MAQMTITNYFNKRKRTCEDIKTRAKVLVVENESGFSSNRIRVVHKDLKVTKFVEDESSNLHVNIPTTIKNYDDNNSMDGSKFCTNKVIYGNQEKAVNKPSQKDNPRNKKCKGNFSKAHINSDIRKMFSKCNDLEENVSGSKILDKEDNIVPRSVIFELKGSLSPRKKLVSDNSVNKKDIQNVEIKEENYIQNSSFIRTVSDQSGSVEGEGKTSLNNFDFNIKESRSELGLKTPSKCITQDLSFQEIKKKVSRSAKLAELKQSLSRFEKCEVSLKVKENKTSFAEKPQLKKFQAIEIEVPSSPQKSIYNSPQKAGTSPLSTPTKSPAYQRYAALVLPSSTALPLPYSYSCLAEIFRCVDTVSSILYNRKEIITFKKLKPSVQEMLRRNFTEHHLGQIKHIYPDAFNFLQAKCRNFGSTSKQDQYDLILTPVLQTSSIDDATLDTQKVIENVSMTPSCLLERRQTFQEKLLDKVKEYHKEFLQNLDPPLEIMEKQLTRWHPEFDLDQVPEIESTSLPQAPNFEKYSSAKDVLERAKNLFNCNHRMEKALAMVSIDSNKQQDRQTTPTKQINKIMGTSTESIFKGVPKALLEKIRAKQAAKALEAMTRSPAQDREAVQHMRLPELARILRNLFIAEKKSVLHMDFVLEKLGNSYREKLPRSDLEEHIQLLIKTVPGWLAVHNIRKTEFIRLSKNADMGRVMKRLETLATEKNGG